MASVVVSLPVTIDKLYRITAPAGTSLYYNGKLIINGGGVGYVIAGIENIFIAVTAAVANDSIIVEEILRSYYDAYDGQVAVWCFQPGLDRWTSKYSFAPEFMTSVGNRLVSFKNGYPYVHNSSSYNVFYGGSVSDSVVAFVHNDAGTQIKSYTNVFIEGDAPDILHCRTEIPNVQSTDIRASEFEVKEGVKYAAILRDRLSPNTTGTYNEKIYKGDKLRGEVALFQGVFSFTSANKLLKFAGIVFNPSKGHQNEQ